VVIGRIEDFPGRSLRSQPTSRLHFFSFLWGFYYQVYKGNFTTRKLSDISTSKCLSCILVLMKKKNTTTIKNKK